MQYKAINPESVLNDKIAKAEKHHYELTIERRIAEALRHDNDIIKADQLLEESNITLSILYSEFDSLKNV